MGAQCGGGARMGAQCGGGARMGAQCGGGARMGAQCGGGARMGAQCGGGARMGAQCGGGARMGAQCGEGGAVVWGCAGRVGLGWVHSVGLCWEGGAGMGARVDGVIHFTDTRDMCFFNIVPPGFRDTVSVTFINNTAGGPDSSLSMPGFIDAEIVDSYSSATVEP